MSIALDGNQFCFIVQIYRIGLLLVSPFLSFSLSVFSVSVSVSILGLGLLSALNNVLVYWFLRVVLCVCVDFMLN